MQYHATKDNSVIGRAFTQTHKPNQKHALLTSMLQMAISLGLRHPGSHNVVAFSQNPTSRSLKCTRYIKSLPSPSNFGEPDRKSKTPVNSGLLIRALQN